MVFAGSLKFLAPAPVKFAGLVRVARCVPGRSLVLFRKISTRGVTVDGLVAKYTSTLVSPYPSLLPPVVNAVARGLAEALEPTCPTLLINVVAVCASAVSGTPSTRAASARATVRAPRSRVAAFSGGRSRRRREDRHGGEAGRGPDAAGEAGSGDRDAPPSAGGGAGRFWYGNVPRGCRDGSGGRAGSGVRVFMIPPEDVRIPLNSPVYYSKTNLYQK